MSEPTREQILEMTETIAKACGMDARITRDSAYGYKYVSTDTGRFNPFNEWDDAHYAADKLEIGPMHITPVICNSKRCWRVGFGYSRNGWEPYEYDAIQQGQLTAFFLALHEAAKAKLEGYQQEDGN